MSTFRIACGECKNAGMDMAFTGETVQEAFRKFQEHAEAVHPEKIAAVWEPREITYYAKEMFEPESSGTSSSNEGTKQEEIAPRK